MIIPPGKKRVTPLGLTQKGNFSMLARIECEGSSINHLLTTDVFFCVPL